MKLYISSVNDAINKEGAESILKKVGITKQLDGFSDCMTNCHCSDFNEGLEIRFDHSKIRLNLSIKKRFLNIIKNLFVPKNKKQPVFRELAGLFQQETSDENIIFLFIDVIFKYNKNLPKILTHELMHINKPLGHCDKPYCIFHDTYQGDDAFNQMKLCDDCQIIYNKILEEINKNDKN